MSLIAKEKVILSIIVPVRNTKRELITCLDTLVHQTLNSFEIIIVDDNSDEDIQGIVETYYEIFPSIIYIRMPETKGPGGARNVGLTKARGQYIGFCDSDDWVDLDYYEKGIHYMQISGAEIGMYSQLREYDYTPELPVYKCKYDSFMELTPDITIKIMTYEMKVGIKVIPPCINKIYKKEFLDKTHAFFEENMYFQDVLFAFYTILSANKIICIPSTVYHHYKRSNSIIQSFDDKHIGDFQKLFLLIKKLLKSKNLYDHYVFNYYKLLDHFYNIIIREIFQFILDEDTRKKYICKSFHALKHIVDLDEYIEYTSAEELRQHIQPHIKDTTLY